MDDGSPKRCYLHCTGMSWEQKADLFWNFILWYNWRLIQRFYRVNSDAIYTAQRISWEQKADLFWNCTLWYNWRSTQRFYRVNSITYFMDSKMKQTEAILYRNTICKRAKPLPTYLGQHKANSMQTRNAHRIYQHAGSLVSGTQPSLQQQNRAPLCLFYGTIGRWQSQI